LGAASLLNFNSLKALNEEKLGGNLLEEAVAKVNK